MGRSRRQMAWSRLAPQHNPWNSAEACEPGHEIAVSRPVGVSLCCWRRRRCGLLEELPLAFEAHLRIDLGRGDACMPQHIADVDERDARLEEVDRLLVPERVGRDAVRDRRPGLPRACRMPGDVSPVNIMDSGIPDFMRLPSSPGRTRGPPRSARRTPPSPLPARGHRLTRADGSGCSRTR